MSDVITTGGAPTTALPAAGPLQGEHFPNAQPVASQLTGQPAQSADPAPKSEPSIAELIRAQREAREAKAKEEARNKDLATQLATTRKELEDLRKSQADFEDDPIGWIKNRGWSREQQLFYGQTMLYDLAPDQAPPDFRQRMFEQRMTRRDREQERARQEAEVRAQHDAVANTINGYVAQLSNEFKTVDEGSYPESSAWFAGSEGAFDHDNYVQSLLHTANNLAEAAAAEGKVADLSPANVARVLEAEVARKMSVRDSRVAARKPSAVAPKEVPGRSFGVQSESLSTRNMNGSGAPRPPAESDADRLKRAAEVAFRTR